MDWRLGALLWACSLHFARAEGDVASFPQATLIDGCVYKNARYHSPNTVRTQTKTWRECQDACAKSTEITCAYFGFYPDVGTCFLAGADAVYTEYLAAGSYAGPAVCPQRPDYCTATITGDYPADSEEESKLAWPQHLVPPKLGCWPKNYKDHTYAACPSVTVLEDTATGWPGKCLGLKEVVVPYGMSCQSWCSKQVSCSVWQEVKDKDPYRPSRCYQTFWSAGVSCYTRTLANGTQALSFKPTRSQRIMHGEVRVLKHIAYAEIEGLKRVFDENYFAKEEDAAKACRMVCYSDLGCQWWLYNKQKGCFVEDISQQALPVPLTLGQYRNYTKTAFDVLHGEYIQHQCKEAGDAAISSHEAIPEYVPTTSAGTASTTMSIMVLTASATGTTTPGPTVPPPIALPAAVGKDQMTPRAIAKEEVNLESMFAVGALTAVGIDLNQIPQNVQDQVRSRYAELISANTGVSKFDVLDLNNEAGKTSLSQWQPHNPVFVRRLQTVEPAISAGFKLLNPKGLETLESVQKSLQTANFQREMTSETLLLLRSVPGALQPPGAPPKVQAHLRESSMDDFFPTGTTSQATKHNNFQIWLIVLGLLLVAAIAALASWVYCSAGPMRKKAVSFDGEDDMAKLKGGQEDWESSAREVQMANSPTRRKIEEAERKAQQMASELAEDLESSKTFQQGQTRGARGYGQSGYGFGQSGYGQSATPSPQPLLSPVLQPMAPSQQYTYSAQAVNPAQVRLIRG